MKRESQYYINTLDVVMRGNDYFESTVYTPDEILLVSIHYIDVKVTSKVKYTIWLTRPGILIGRAGVKIDALKTQLKQYLKKDVEIELKEFDPFFPRHYAVSIRRSFKSKVKRFFSKVNDWITELFI